MILVGLLRALGHRCSRPARPCTAHVCWCGQRWLIERGVAGERWAYFRVAS